MTLQGICQVLMGSALVVAMAGSAVAQEHVVGQTGPGALYALDMPAAWNGDLVVYAHGIVDPVLPVALPSAQDNFTSVRDALLARGFAVASSSFSGNGFILKDAAQRTHQLTGLFTARFSPPRRVRARGTFPWIDCGAAACRDLRGTIRRRAGDVRVCRRHHA